MELKRLDLAQQTFVANGRTYKIENGFSIARYAEYQVLEKELSYGFTFKTMDDKLVQAYGLLNSLKLADAAVLIHDLRSGIAKIEERQPAILKMCALFINTAEEDRSTITTDMIDEKIADWQAEGIDVRDFFTLALNTMDGFIEAYNSLTRATSALKS